MMKARESLQLKEMLRSMEENFKKSFIFSFLTYFTKLGKFLASEKNDYANDEVKQKFKEIYQNSNFIIKWWFKFYINPNDQKRFNDFVSNQQPSPIKTSDSLEHQNNHHITQEQNESEKSSDVAPQAPTESSDMYHESLPLYFKSIQDTITQALKILDNETPKDKNSNEDSSSFDIKAPTNTASIEQDFPEHDRIMFYTFVSNQQLSPTDSLEHQNHHHITQEPNESEKNSDVAPQALTESSNEPFENLISLFYFTQAQITKALNILEKASSNDIDLDEDGSSFDMRLDSKHPINSASFESELALQVSNNSDFPTPENQETSEIEIKNILNELITSCEMSTTEQTQRPTAHKNNKAQFSFQEESLMDNECKITLASLFTVIEKESLKKTRKLLPPPPPKSFF